MAEIISINAARQAKSETVDEAFNAYAQAAVKAQTTLDIRDAIVAGRAWARFINLFAVER